MRMKVFGCGVALVLAVGWSATVSAAVPSQIAVQGVVRSGGGPVADGDYAFLLKLHDAKADGKELWTSGPLKLSVSGGMFSYTMGPDKALDGALAAAGAGGVWLGVTIGANPELVRTRLTSVPFARRAAIADGLSCSGCIEGKALAAGTITPSAVGFAYAGAADGIKGGAAKVAKDLDCTGCVTNKHLKFGADLDLAGFSLVAGKVTVAGDVIAKGTVAAAKFVGDGSGLTGLNLPSGSCTKKGEVVRGINKDGTLLCVAALDPSALPSDGLDEISGGLLTNQFANTWSGDKTVPIPDNNPGGALLVIDVPDRGLAQQLTVAAKVSNSDIKQLTVSLTDPAGKVHVLHSKSGTGKLVDSSWPDKTKLVSGDLGAWIGKNPVGKWTLRAVDSVFLNNKTDGQIDAFAITVKTQSNKKVAATGGLQFHVASKPPLPCDKTHIGLSYVGAKGEALYICNGDDYAPVYISVVGTQKNPADSCGDILSKQPATKSGVYWVQSGGKSVQVHCDMDSHSGGWTALARVHAKTFEYNSNLWTTANVLNDTATTPAWDSAKFATFNTLKVSELLIVSQAGKSVVLKLPNGDKTLREWFALATTTILKRTAGVDGPLALVDGRSATYCGEKWRINTKGSYAAYIRLGGWMNKQWDCSYGSDKAGQTTGAHLVGLGLRDNQWGPFSKNMKSFGIRDAHDQNYFGQTESAARIYAR